MGFPNGAFVRRFKEKIEESSRVSIQGEGVSELILKLVENTNGWEGTSSDLLQELRKIDESLGNVYASSLPRNPSALGRGLNNSVVSLQSVGIVVKKITVKNKRFISIKRVNLDSERSGKIQQIQ
jgi:hypothetical protein